jgi:hypothetical protein
MSVINPLIFFNYLQIHFIFLHVPLKGQSNEILIPFFTYTYRPWPKYEPLLIYKIFQKPRRFYNKHGFLLTVKKKFFWKNNIFRKFFLNSRKLFRNIIRRQYITSFRKPFINHKKVSESRS